MLAVIVQSIVGLILLIGFFVGSVLIIARAIAKNTAHDQRTCDCVDCRDRRRRAHAKRYGTDPTGRVRAPVPQGREGDPDWLSTTELRIGMLLDSKSGKMYRVARVTDTGKQWLVVLANEETGKEGLPIVIQLERIYDKIWRRA